MPLAIISPRLFLRPVELADAIPMAALMSPTIAKMQLSWPDELTFEEARTRIIESRCAMQQDHWVDWAVFLKPDLHLIGWLRVGRSDRQDSVLELCYWLGEAYQQRGFGSEAVAAVIDQGLTGFSANMIEAYCAPPNTASIKLLDRLGFALVGRERRYAAARGRDEDSLRFVRNLRGDESLNAPSMYAA
ncbi:MAG: GNAT family N-acetyltransferase [Sphingopyxis sp.]|nr:GNAT family N-acetyltransferase [Sphingopyxis sp.]